MILAILIGPFFWRIPINQIDFAATLRAIRDIGYTGWITIELYPYIANPDEAARLALERVTAIVKSL